MPPTHENEINELKQKCHYVEEGGIATKDNAGKSETNAMYERGEKAFAEEGLVLEGRHYRRDDDLSS